MNGLNISEIVDTLFELGMLYLILWSFLKPVIQALQFKIKNPKVADVVTGADKVANGIVASQLQASTVFGSNQKQKATVKLVSRINKHVGHKVLTEKTAEERIELAYQKQAADQNESK